MDQKFYLQLFSFFLQQSAITQVMRFCQVSIFVHNLLLLISYYFFNCAFKMINYKH